MQGVIGIMNTLLPMASTYLKSTVSLKSSVVLRVCFPSLFIFLIYVNKHACCIEWVSKQLTKSHLCWTCSLALINFHFTNLCYTNIKNRISHKWLAVFLLPHPPKLWIILAVYTCELNLVLRRFLKIWGVSVSFDQRIKKNSKTK